MKLPLALLLTLSLISAFTIIKQEEKPLRENNWPFFTCGNGTWTMKSLTLSSVPSRMANVTVTARGIANFQTELLTVAMTVIIDGFQAGVNVMDFEQSLKPGDDLEFTMNLDTPGSLSGSYELVFNHHSMGSINGCWGFFFNLK